MLLNFSNLLTYANFIHLQDKGVDETIFQNPNKLHMTLGTLVLMDKNEIGKASALLEECKQDLAGQVLGYFQ